jgi:hypothetical protein
VKSFIASMLCLASSLVAVEGRAADVTFKVPIDVSGFPAEVSSISIGCYLQPQSNFGKATSVALQNGAFKGVVTIEINLSGAISVEAPKITGYQCTLMNAGAKVGTQQGIAVALDGSSYTSSYRAPAATTPVSKVTGSIKLTPKP